MYHADSEWLLFDVEITGAIDGLDFFQVEWSLRTNTDDLSEFGGWNIDDVEVFTIYWPFAGFMRQPSRT